MSKQHTLYLADDRLLLVKSRSNKKLLTIEASWQQQLPQGTILNGIINNSDALIEGLVELKKQAKLSATKVMLVIDSSQIMAKTLSVPLSLTSKETAGVVRTELSGLDSSDRDLIFDYSELVPTQQQELLCFGIERTFVEQLTELFEKAGIKLAGITSALSSCVQMVQFLPELSKLSFILCVLDGQTVVTYLFAGGRYLMNARSRLITERGTPAVLGELLGRVSSMLQFSQSNKTAEPAQTVYFCGLEPNEEPGCRVVADTFNITAKPLPDVANVAYNAHAGILLPDMFPICGCMLSTKYKAVNFLGAFEQKDISSLEKKSGRLPWAIPAGLAGLMFLAWLVVLFGNYRLDQQIKEIKAYTTDPNNISLSQQAKATRSIISYYSSATAEANRAISILESSPQVTSELLYRAASIFGDSGSILEYHYTASSNTIIYGCSVADYRSIPTIVERLSGIGDYWSVSYTGYSLNNQTGQYNFNLTCVLNEVE